MKSQQPKGGFAAAFIMAAVIGMFFFYMIMVYPSTREKLLRPNVSNATQPEINGIFKDMNTYYVGGGKSRVNFEYNLGNVSVGYPLEEINVGNYSFSMSSTIFTHDNREYKLIPSNDTKDFKLVIDVKKINGKLDVYSGNTLLKEIKGVGIYSILTNGSVKLVFSHVGYAFWEKQVANVNLVIYDERYVNEGNTYSKDILINNPVGEFLGIKFNVTERQKGKLDIYFNNKLLYSGIPNEEMKIQVPFDQVKIYSKNSLKIVAERGADYTLSNFTIYLFSGASPTLDKVYYINEINQSVKIGVKTRILAPGILSISLLPKKTVYFINKGMVINNDWNWFNVDANMMNGTRAIRVYSPDGKFEIDGFVIVPR